MVIKCNRCNQEFDRTLYLDRHLSRKNKCFDLNGELLKRDMKYKEEIDKYKKEIEEYKSQIQNYMVRIEDYQNKICELSKYAKDNNNEVINKITNINNIYGDNINNINISINPTVAFGNESSEHIPIERLLEITSMGHPMGTMTLLEEIYGHESNLGTIVVKNRKKGLYNVSDGRGGYIEMTRDTVKQTVADRITAEGHRVIKYIYTLKDYNVGSNVDSHYNTNLMILKMSGLNKKDGTDILNKLIDTSMKNI